MSDPAQTVRLHILLCDGLSGLSRIVDRLAVVGLTPREMWYRVLPHDRGVVRLDFLAVDRVAAEQLACRLRQLVPVRGVRMSST